MTKANCLKNAVLLVLVLSVAIVSSAEAKVTSREALGEIHNETYVNKIMGIKASFSKDNWKIANQSEISDFQNEVRSQSTEINDLFSQADNTMAFLAMTHDSMSNINIVVSNMGIMSRKIKKDSEIRDLVKQTNSGLKEQYKSFGCEKVDVKNISLNFAGKNCYGAEINTTINGINMYQKQVYYIADEYYYIITATSALLDITDELLAMFKTESQENAKITSKEAIGKVQGETYVNKVMGTRAYFSKDNWKIMTPEEILKSQTELQSSSKNLEELLSNSNNVTVFFAATHDTMANINIVVSKMGIMSYRIKKDSEVRDFAKQITSGLKEELYKVYESLGCKSIDLKNIPLKFIGKNCYGAEILVTLNNGVKMYQKQVYYITDEYCYTVTATSIIADITDDLLAMFKKSLY